MMQRKTILVAPLNWGLGHATRCIPIISELIEHGFNVIVASDGQALELIKQEFPKLRAITLPSYNITYPKNGAHFKWQMLLHTPHILATIKAEKKLISSIVKKNAIAGIISDNRWGVRHKNIPSVFVTHQLQVLSGSTTFISSKIHQRIINKFTQCWVPDIASSKNLSGKLGYLNETSLHVKHIGPLSRMNKKIVDNDIDILIILSGPEPQRTLLEETLLIAFKDDLRKIVLVRGVIESEQKERCYGSIKIINFLKTDALAALVNRSKLIIARSGYTTIMDLSILEKKAFFIPTPGQYEQEYLAKRLDSLKWVPFCTQEEFDISELEKCEEYQGLKNVQKDYNYSKLFSLFHGK